MSRLRHASAALLVCAFALTAHADAHKKTKARTKHPKPAATETVEEAPPPSAAGPVAPITGDAGVPSVAPGNEKPASSLPAEHTPKLEMKVEPPNGVKLGDVVHIEITAEVPVGDDVTVADQSFAPFEVYKKQARVEPPSGDKQRFVFGLDLLAVETGDKALPAINLRVVTKDNSVGSVSTEPRPFKVQSLLANEPNAQPKLETKPVAVLEDN
jgi:hypothetical protein